MINLLIPQREKEMNEFMNYLLRRDQLAVLWNKVIAGILYNALKLALYPHFDQASKASKQRFTVRYQNTFPASTRRTFYPNRRLKKKKKKAGCVPIQSSQSAHLSVWLGRQAGLHRANQANQFRRGSLPQNTLPPSKSVREDKGQKDKKMSALRRS